MCRLMRFYTTKYKLRLYDKFHGIDHLILKTIKMKSSLGRPLGFLRIVLYPFTRFLNKLLKSLLLFSYPIFIILQRNDNSDT